MDQLTLLRKVHDDARPSEAALNAGRTALASAITADATPARKNRRRIRRVGFSALAAGLVVTGLVATNVVGLAGWRGSADAAAADVLREAARAAISTADPQVGPGQYLKIDTVAVGTAFGESVDRVEGDYQYRSRMTEYIPHDPEDEWVRVNYPGTLERTFGPRSEAVVANETFGGKVNTVRAPEGHYYRSDDTFLEAPWPRNPYLLLNRIYLLTAGTGPSADGEALVTIADILRTGTAPGDLRAALFEAAAMIPGVTITDDAVTLDGRVGVGIGRYEPEWRSRQELIIDPDTGLLIGEREVLIASDPSSEIPAGTVLRWSTVTTSVVNDAP
jgi:RNA polymerase sigma-70 factor (ECF subfamily)